MDARLATLQFLNLHNHTYQWARHANRHWSALELSREYCRTLLHGMAVDGTTFCDIEQELEQVRTRQAAAAGSAAR